MTVPIHSVKHLKTTYRKYQMLALFSASITILAVLIAALFSFQLSRASKSVKRTADSELSSSTRSLNKEIQTLNNKIAELEKQAGIDKATIENLNTNSKELNKKLTEARNALNAAATSASSMIKSGNEGSIITGISM